MLIAYKFVKGSIQLMVAGVAAGLLLSRTEAMLTAHEEALRHHVANAWSLWLIGRLIAASTTRHLWILTVALAFDGVLGLAEGWALRRGLTWGPWLVAGLTASLLPIEAAGIAAHGGGAGRMAILALNTIVAVYLLRYAQRERSMRN